MTALKEYQRLEATGLWRETNDAQRREVIVSFGEATLALSDQNDVALSHWSLAAITRCNPGETPAIYAPDPDHSETLEINDAEMAAAIDKVLAAIEKRHARPGRLRAVISGTLVLVMLVLSVWLVPGILARQTANALPASLRYDTGERLLRHIHLLAGQACNGRGAAAALVALRTRVATDMPDDPESRVTALRHIILVPSAVRSALHLPGGIIVLDRALVEDFETPEVAAGFILDHDQQRRKADPVVRLLRHLGVVASLKLLTSGKISDDDLRHYAEFLLARSQPIGGAPSLEEPFDPEEISTTQTARQRHQEALLESFRAAQLSAGPYAFARDPTGETTLTLIEADPYPGGSVPPVLGQTAWRALQNACGG